MKMIKLLSPDGIIYLNTEAIAVIAECRLPGKNGTTVCTRIWLVAEQEPFNVLESVGYVYGAIINAQK